MTAPRPGQGETRSTHNQSSTPGAAPGADGSARPRAEPQLPHEADESAYSQERASASQVDVGEQAYADQIGPSQDTDRQGPMDELYNRTLAPDRGDEPPRR